MKARKFLTLTLVLLVLFTFIPKTNIQAAEVTIPSTINYYVLGGTLFIEGTGEIPDFIGSDAVANRPWSKWYFSRIVIGPGITRVGENAFSYNKYLHYVNVTSSTYFANNSCFAESYYDLIFRVSGQNTTKQVGNISYSSYESILAGAPLNDFSAFIMDDADCVKEMQSLANPAPQFVYEASDEKAPWLTREATYRLSDVKLDGNIVDDNKLLSATILREERSLKFVEGLSAFCQDVFFYGDSYKLTLNNFNAQAKTTATEYKYTINLQEDTINPLMNYQVMLFLPDGTITFAPDLDSNPATVTFATNAPVVNLSVIYSIY